MSNLDSKFRAKDTNGLGLTKNNYTDVEKDNVSTIVQNITYPLTIVNGFYVNPSGVGELASASRCYTTITNDGAKHYITAVISGGAMRFIFFYNQSNTLISTIGLGVDGQNTTYTDYEVIFPANCAYYKVNGLIAQGGVILKKRQNMFNYLGNVLSSKITQTATLEETGKYPWSNGTIQIESGRKYSVFNISPTDTLYVNTVISGSPMWAVIYLNSSNQVVGMENQGVNGVNSFITDYKLTIPISATKLYLSGLINQPYNLQKYTVFTRALSPDDLVPVNTRLTNLEAGSSSLLAGKTFVHYGTSIPEGGLYPTNAPASLGGVGINLAIGSSTCRFGKADGSYAGLAWENYVWALAATTAEKQNIIDNWSTIRTTLGNNPPVTLDSAAQTKILQSSYEYRLLRYLNGTLPMPDFFIFDHGRNDNFSSDSDSFFETMPTVRNDRRTFLGAMNFLFDLILQYNPYARIAIVGHYENDALVGGTPSTRICNAQTVLADYWNIPILKMWEYTGFSQQIVVGSQSLWTQAPWNLYTSGQNTSADMIRQRVYMPDGIHPHSDTTGKTRTMLTNIYAKFIRDLV